MLPPPSRRSPRCRAERASSLVLAAAVTPLLIGMASLAVDFGRLSLARSELGAAADSAARYGAAQLGLGVVAARRAAVAAAADNLADGSTVVIGATDVEFGLFTPATRQFQVLADTSPSINAVRVTARRTKAKGNATKLGLASVIGFPSADLAVASISIYYPREVIDTPVNGAANPWLAGMADGTLDNTNLYNASVRKDRAGSYTDSSGVFHPGGESPSLMTAVALKAGEMLQFDAVAGTGANGATQTVVGPDGDAAKISTPWAGAHLGKSSIRAPISSVVAVFLTDADPTSATPPDALDFSTAAQRDFATLSPQIGQVFFIGDGLTSGGVQQQFEIPAGATRLFIAKMDGTEWNNNVGQSTVTTHRPARVTLVR